jgi:hypothetical protein
LLLSFGMIATSAIVRGDNNPKINSHIEVQTLPTIEENSFLPIVSHCFINEVTLGSMIDIPDEIKRVMDEIDYNNVSTEDKLLLSKIIMCESGGNELAINSKFGEKGGVGLLQIIPSTVKMCENALGKKINPLDIKDNIECGIYLLTETPQGANHWGYPPDDPRGYIKVNGEDFYWGSWLCFASESGLD